MSDISIDITLDNESVVDLVDGRIHLIDNTKGVGIVLQAPVVDRIRRHIGGVFGRPTHIQVQPRADGELTIWFDPIGHVVLDQHLAGQLADALGLARERAERAS